MNREQVASLDAALASYWSTLKDGAPVGLLISAMQIVADTQDGLKCAELLRTHNRLATERKGKA